MKMRVKSEKCSLPNSTLISSLSTTHLLEQCGHGTKLRSKVLTCAGIGLPSLIASVTVLAAFSDSRNISDCIFHLAGVWGDIWRDGSKVWVWDWGWLRGWFLFVLIRSVFVFVFVFVFDCCDCDCCCDSDCVVGCVDECEETEEEEDRGDWDWEEWDWLCGTLIGVFTLLQSHSLTTSTPLIWALSNTSLLFENIFEHILICLCNGSIPKFRPHCGQGFKFIFWYLFPSSGEVV